MYNYEKNNCDVHFMWLPGDKVNNFVTIDFLACLDFILCKINITFVLLTSDFKLGAHIFGRKLFVIGSEKACFVTQKIKIVFSFTSRKN